MVSDSGDEGFIVKPEESERKNTSNALQGKEQTIFVVHGPTEFGKNQSILFGDAC